MGIEGNKANDLDGNSGLGRLMRSRKPERRR